MPSTIRNFIGYAARRVVWRGWSSHRPADKPPIVIFTSRRSGGTWLTDALAAERGLLTVLQPFAIGLSDPYLIREAEVPRSLLLRGRVPIRPDDEEWMRGFCGRMLRGDVAVGWPATPWSRRYQRRTDRVLVKLHNAKAWIEWFSQTFPEAILGYHLRPPIPQDLSALRTGWPLRIDAYMRDRSFVSEHLNDGLLREIQELSAQGTPFEQALLNWFVENLAPLRTLAAAPSWLTTTYEEMVANPEAVFDRLIDTLELDCGEAIRTGMRLPSHTVFDWAKSRAIEESGDSPNRRKALIAGWRERISDEDLRRARAIFDLFDIGAYRTDDPLPDPSLWLSPDSFRWMQ